MSARADVIVLGAGMVGWSQHSHSRLGAWHPQRQSSVRAMLQWPRSPRSHPKVLFDDGSCQILDFALMAGRSDPGCALNSSCAIKRNLACDGTISRLLLTTTACR